MMLVSENIAITYRELGLTASSAPLNPKCLQHSKILPATSAAGLMWRHVLFSLLFFYLSIYLSTCNGVALKSNLKMTNFELENVHMKGRVRNGEKVMTLIVRFNSTFQTHTTKL